MALSASFPVFSDRTGVALLVSEMVAYGEKLRSEVNQFSDLAEELEIEKSTVGRLIDHVEARGWIERRPTATDRRLWRVHLTE